MNHANHPRRAGVGPYGLPSRTALALAISLGLSAGARAHVNDAATAPLPAARKGDEAVRDEFLFIDERVARHGDLEAAVRSGVRTLVVSPDQDGIALIGATLRDAPATATVHVLGHGQPGAMQLGSARLDDASIERYRDQLTTWFAQRNSAKRRPEILLYGCEVGAGAIGRGFVDHLARVTQADVAASVDLTGGIAANANWDLELATGRIQASLPFDRAAADAYASTLAALTVTNLLDDNSAGSLRTVIAGSAAGDVITFQAGLTGNIALTNGTITIKHPLTITGPGAANLTVTGGGGKGGRVFYVYSDGGGKVSMSGLTITGGLIGNGGAGKRPNPKHHLAHASGNLPHAPNGGGIYACGGGIFSNGVDLDLDSVTVTGNTANRGGGICFVGNSVTLNLTNSTVSTNSTLLGDGGGLYFGGDSYCNANVGNTTFSGNYGYRSGGAVATENSGGLTITGSTFTNNSAFTQGGAVFVDDLHQASTISGSTFTTNASTAGGAISLYVDYNVRHTVDSSVISGNFAYNQGGGVYLFGYANGPVSITRDEISANFANRFGGGVFIPAGCYQGCDIKNTTVSGNAAAYASGVAIASSGGYNPVNVVNSTIAFNTGKLPYASGLYAYDGTVNLRNTIVANNVATGAGAFAADLGGPATGITAAFSLVQGTHATTALDTSAGGNLLGVDPMLGALSGNGSLTRSHLPQEGSPVINAASNALALSAGLLTDQRGPGFPRDFDHVVDIGAVEVGFTGVPTLGDAGKMALVLFCGAAGLALLRRRQRGAVAFSVLALGGGWFSIHHAEAAPAVQHGTPMVGRVESMSATTVAKVELNGNSVTVDLGDGQHYTLPTSKFQTTFERQPAKMGRVVNGSHKLRADQIPPTPADYKINPGDNVVARVHKDKNGNVVQVMLVKFASSSEAQRFVTDRKAKQRHPHDKP